MHDLIFCVLATTKNNRLPQFTKIGYKKSNKYKIKIIYLVNNEDKPEFLEGEWFNCPNHSPSTRLAYYFSKTADESRWFMQVDDDSCTDLDKTIELLDYFYDDQDPVMLTGSSSYFPIVPRYIDRTPKMETLFLHTIDPKLQQVLKKMQIENLFVETSDLNNFEFVPRLCHGWEHNVFSFAGVKKIKKYNRLEEYIEHCLECKPEFGDEVPFLLSKIAKIPISQCYFLTPLPELEEYTGINKNGRFTHIHHMAEPLDLIFHLENIIENKFTFENKKQVCEYLEKNPENTEWFFFHVIDNKISARCAMKLNLDHSIEIMNISIANIPDYFKINFNYEKYELQNKKWQMKNGKITITNDKNQNLDFSKIKDKMYGSIINEKEFFILSKISPVDKLYWNRKKFFGNVPERIS
jgi:hypothetical protein